MSVEIFLFLQAPLWVTQGLWGCVFSSSFSLSKSYYSSEPRSSLPIARSHSWLFDFLLFLFLTNQCPFHWRLVSSVGLVSSVKCSAPARHGWSLARCLFTPSAALRELSIFLSVLLRFHINMKHSFRFFDNKHLKRIKGKLINSIHFLLSYGTIEKNPLAHLKGFWR